jgi:hypothetical protein
VFFDRKCPAQATLGPKHLDCAQTLLNLGCLHMEEKEAVQASVRFSRAAQIRW